MTREEFVNIFVRKNKLIRSINRSIIALIVGVIFYCCLVLLSYGLHGLWNVAYFIVGWFIAEAMTVGYYFVFVYDKEKLKLDEEIIKDIIE
jgi:hypothetical protein